MTQFFLLFKACSHSVCYIACVTCFLISGPKKAMMQFFWVWLLKLNNKTHEWMTITLCEKCPKTELFLVRIFLYLDWIQIFTSMLLLWDTGYLLYKWFLKQYSVTSELAHIEKQFSKRHLFVSPNCWNIAGCLQSTLVLYAKEARSASCKCFWCYY